MKEKELRLALVCYGGVSLVLYMQGVTKEFLKLVRASSAYQSIPDISRRQGETYSTIGGRKDREQDTESVYFALLQTLGKTLDLRVIVDSIAGASAGGISGIILARALAHDLSIDHLRREWLEETDVLRLLAKKKRAHAWSKWFLYPILWVVFRSSLLGLKTNAEIRTKLSTFIRSRWLEAPFDGDRFLGMLFDGLLKMRKSENENSSLLPLGHVLDLAVSVTDFFGYPHRMKINTPNIIQEREHALLWAFRYCRWEHEKPVSDMDDDNVAALALAARATSSLPGAFSPVQLGDIDRLLKERGLEWPSRSKFMERNFKEHIRAGIDPAKTSFVDGGIVNDKPLSAAIDAIRQRASDRDVDRRLVYIDPDPQPKMPPPDGKAPSFLQTLETTFFEIPLRTPIHQELEKLANFNLSITRMREILAAAQPDINHLVSKVIDIEPQGAQQDESIAAWRKKANDVAAQQAGYAYQVYARSKSASVLDQITGLVSELGELSPNSPAQFALAAEIRAWADSNDIVVPEGALSTLASHRDESAWITFLRRYDYAYRHRRVSFVVQTLNELYTKLGAGEFVQVESNHLDEVKAKFEEPLRRFRAIRSCDFASSDFRHQIKALSAALQTQDTKEGRRLRPGDGIGKVMDRLADEFDLAGIDASIDRIVASFTADHLPSVLRHEILVHFLGFAFWDVWTFPMSEWHELEEHREIRVDRISPADPSALGIGDLGTRLQGAQLRDFAGFLSRSIRENDYLWGRLNGAERLIDIVCDAARVEDALAGIDAKAIKKSAFLSILETEARWLKDKALLESVRKLVDSM